MKHELSDNDVQVLDTCRLGKGSYGTVYKGRYCGKHVAVKVLNAELTKDAASEFRREVDLMLELKCPQIIVTYGAVLTPRQAIVMELMPNGSLYNLLRRQPDLSWDTKYQIALDVSYGLNYLHTRQPAILHLDLKSLNVLLDASNQAKICDFGLARVKESTRNPMAINHVSGSPAWMAPELFNRKSGKCSQASDVYALGMTFYEMLAHKIPFEDGTNFQTPYLIGVCVQRGNRPDLCNEGPDNFKALIQQCWAQDPALRPTAKAVVDQLEKSDEIQALLAEQKKEVNRSIAATSVSSSATDITTMSTTLNSSEGTE